MKAVQFLNEMIVNALSHAEDCLDFMRKIQDPMFFRFYAVPRVSVLYAHNLKMLVEQFINILNLYIMQLDSIGELALCYNNPQIFTKTVKPKNSGKDIIVINFLIENIDIDYFCKMFFCYEFTDLKARIFNRTKTMRDVYGAFYDVSCLMETKVNNSKFQNYILPFIIYIRVLNLYD